MKIRVPLPFNQSLYLSAKIHVRRLYNRLVKGGNMKKISLAIVIAMIVMFTVYGMRIASEARDDFGRWLATGITMLISGQALFNIAMVCGVMPVTGVPLPFLSYGVSSLTTNLMLVAILLNIKVKKQNLQF